MNYLVSRSMMERLDVNIVCNDKIRFIKLVREVTGVSLTLAKYAVDMCIAQNAVIGVAPEYVGTALDVLLTIQFIVRLLNGDIPLDTESVNSTSLVAKKVLGNQFENDLLTETVLFWTDAYLTNPKEREA